MSRGPPTPPPCRRAACNMSTMPEARTEPTSCPAAPNTSHPAASTAPRPSRKAETRTSTSAVWRTTTLSHPAARSCLPWLYQPHDHLEGRHGDDPQATPPKTTATFTARRSSLRAVAAATSNTVESGGAQRVHGFADDTTIALGGTERVFSGGAADVSQVYGSEVVSSGGSGYGDTVHTGGLFTVSSGAFVSGGLTISGGYAGISCGAVASGQEVLFGRPWRSRVLQPGRIPGERSAATPPATSSTSADLRLEPAKQGAMPAERSLS